MFVLFFDFRIEDVVFIAYKFTESIGIEYFLAVVVSLYSGNAEFFASYADSLS